MLAARVIPNRAEQSNGAANTMMFQNQFETLAEVHFFVEGDLNHPIKLLSAVYFFDCRRNRRRIAESLEVCPGVYDVAVRQKELARLACRFIESFLIG